MLSSLLWGEAAGASASSSSSSTPFAVGGAHAGWSLARQVGIRATQPDVAATLPHGLDVSSHQGNVNWTAVKSHGAEFAYIKATEGNYYTNPYWAQQYKGAYNVRIIRGAYHFANPSKSTGAAQADYFIHLGGGWTSDGWTLPGALDMEYNPYGSECYGLSKSGMVSWITSFLNEYHTRMHIWAVIFTTAGWWNTCTGNSTTFRTNDPLWLAHYASIPGTIPGGWSFYTFWQYADSGTFPGDQDVFNGSYSRLQVLAKQG
jgi:GH25 family lysozyme M1 (1,4-beta-N-acetylmuramidase)